MQPRLAPAEAKRKGGSSTQATTSTGDEDDLAVELSLEAVGRDEGVDVIPRWKGTFCCKHLARGELRHGTENTKKG